LGNCIRYRRVTGAFSSSALVLWADAIRHIVKEEIKIEILTAPDLDRNTYETIKNTLDPNERKSILLKSSNKILLSALGLEKDPSNTDYRRQLLTWLIANEQLVIRFAYMKDYHPYPDFVEHGHGNVRTQFHTKDGYFIFDNGDRVAFTGTFNETHTGLDGSVEKVSCFRSWEAADSERLEDTIKEVDADWDGKNEYTVVEPPSKETLKTIKRWSPKRRPKKPDDKGTTTIIEEIPVQVFKIPDWVNYRDGDWKFQGEAVDAWCGNKYRGILAMATGSGKTITAMICAYHLFQKKKPLLIVVAAPYLPLLMQWGEEIKKFGLEPIFLKGPPRNQRKKLTEVRMDLEMRAEEVSAIVITYDALCGDFFLDEMKKFSKVSLLLIADEVHNLGGRQKFINDPPDFFNARLALSATPDRQYDEEGTDELFKYFGSNSESKEKNAPVYEFSLSDALDAGILVPYDYYVHPVELNDEEIEDWEDLSRKIGQLSAQGEKDVQGQKHLNMLLIKRRKILDIAEGKIPALKRALEEEEKIGHTLIYATDKDPEQLKDVHALLRELDINFHQITKDETSDSKLVSLLREQIKEGSLSILTSKRVLDEGVNIPEVSKAFILASTTVKRQWIQRRGRVLRKCPDIGKTKSTIHDFVAMPPRGGTDKFAKQLARGELNRISEFAHSASNLANNDGPFKIINKLFDLINIDS